MESTALVSCIIPSYKRSDTLRRAIDSALGQTYKNIEILVVDDNENGDEYSVALRSIVSQYGSQVRLVTQNIHVNGAVARNEGVKAAFGEYIAFLDDDDEWWPDKIEKQIQILQTDDGLSGVAGGVTLWRDGVELSKLPNERIPEDGLLMKVLTREVGLATSSFLCKKSSFEAIGGFNPSLKRSQDLQLFADFLHEFRIYPVWDFRTTKMHVESAMNRLDSKRLAINKEEFFCAIDEVLKTFSLSAQKRIKSAHYYEIAFVAFKEKKYLFAIKYIFKGARSLSSLMDLYRRYKAR